MLNQILYIFIDESGDLNFSPTGSQYFLLTSVSTLQPTLGRDKFLDLKYKLFSEGHNKESFHATEDLQVVRDQVFKIINDLSDFEVDCVVVQKNKTNPTLFEEYVPSPKGPLKIAINKVEEKFYKQISETLLKYVLRRHSQMIESNQISKVVIILDSLFPNAKREFVTKYLKSYFKVNSGIVPHVHFCKGKFDVNCQIADYCSWAMYLKWERNGSELRPYNLVKKFVKSEFDIFERGTTIYY